MQNVLLSLIVITFSFTVFPTLNTSGQEEHSVDSQFQGNLAGCESDIEHSVDSQFRDNSIKYRNPN
jgi:hypothetical protein